jgi:opacity protein-like surface antigen
MKTSVAAALAGLTLAPTPTLGADLFGTAPPPMTFPASQSPQAEVGSNWYLRGDVGYGSENEPTVVPSAGLIPTIQTDALTGYNFVDAPSGDASHNVPVTRGNNQTKSGPTFDIGVGYRVNNYLRLEATYKYWSGPGLSSSKGTLCPDTSAAVDNYEILGGSTTPSPVPAGNLWEPASCTGYVHATQYNNLGLASAYLDLGTLWGVTPYVGVGAGLNANTINGTSTFYLNSDGSHFNGNTATGGTVNTWVVPNGTLNGYTYYQALSTQPNVTFGNQNWDRHFSSTHYSMAGALMAGLGYQLTPSATLDVGYQYLSADLFGSTKSTFQQLLVGIRYMAN